MPTALQMTRRQTEVMALVGDGSSDKEIAALLGISPQMVKAHVSQVRNRILLAYPTLKGGRPRPVILRYFRFAERVAFAKEGA